jgi:hypothetical protein
MKLMGPIEGSADLEEILAPALRPGERLAWVGQPAKVTAALHTHLAVLLGGFGAGGFLAARVLADMELTSRGFLLATALFMLAGMAVAAAALRGILALQRRATVYGLTRDAAFLRQGFPRARTVVLDLAALPHVDLALGNHDMGTITFGRGPDAPAFRHVRHARHVFDLARKGRLEEHDT